MKKSSIVLTGAIAFMATLVFAGCQSSSNGIVLQSSSILHGTQPRKVSAATFNNNGFRLIEKRTIAAVDGTAYILEHVQSGAHVYYVANDDKNLSFNITVSTPPESDNGANHVLEHICLASTKNYPGKEVFNGAANTTINTYMNAATSNTYIEFPFATTDQRQYQALADYYLSAVFEPSLEEFAFMREGWRYEMADENSPLTVNGIVYNEMKGANASILRVASKAVTETLFCDTLVKNDYAGDPENIPSLSGEQLKAYHKKYFVPCNTIIGIYGDVEIESFLEFLDRQWLCHYQKTGDLAKIEPQKPFEKSKYIFRQLPVSANTPTAGKSAISKGYALSGISDKDLPVMQLTLRILNNQNSPLIKSLNKSRIADSYSVFANSATRQPQVEFVAENINSAKASTFEKLVLDALNQIAQNGVESDLFESEKTNFYASALLARENTEVGLDLLSGMAADQITIGYRYASAQASYAVQDVTVEDIKNFVKKYFISNNHSALVIVEPKAGLAEQKEQEQAEKLADLKNRMSDSQRKSIVKKTKDFKAWLEEEDKAGAESVKKLQVLTPQNLNPALESYDIAETTEDGVLYLSTQASEKALMTRFMLNVSHLDKEELQYAKLYTSLIGGLPAGTYTEDQIDYQLSMLILGMTSRLHAQCDNYQTENYYPVLDYYWFAEPKNAQKAENLMTMILYDSVLDPNRLKVLVAMAKANIERAMQSYSYSFAATRARAACFDGYILDDYLNGVPYYLFLQKVYKDMNKNPSNVIEKMITVRDKMLCANQPVVMYCGGKTNALTKPGKNLVSRLSPYSGRTGKNYKGLPKPAQKEAVIINDSASVVSGVAVDGSRELAYSIAADILTNEYYTPKIRLEGGAYGAGASINRLNARAFLAYSFRDPQVEKTISTFNMVPYFAKNAGLTDQSIAPYLIAYYGRRTAPNGHYGEALLRFNNYLIGYTPEAKLKDLQSIGSIKAKEVADAMQDISARSQYTVFLSESEKNACKLEFDAVINLIEGK